MTMETKEEYEQEEWGGWKFVSEMLDNPINDIYPTGKCYKQLYDFVVAQKKKAISLQLKELEEKIEGQRKNYTDFGVRKRAVGFNEGLDAAVNIIKEEMK